VLTRSRRCDFKETGHIVKKKVQSYGHIKINTKWLSQQEKENKQ